MTAGRCDGVPGGGRGGGPVSTDGRERSGKRGELRFRENTCQVRRARRHKTIKETWEPHGNGCFLGRCFINACAVSDRRSTWNNLPEGPRLLAGAQGREALS